MITKNSTWKIALERNNRYHFITRTFQDASDLESLKACLALFYETSKSFHRFLVVVLKSLYLYIRK